MVNNTDLQIFDVVCDILDDRHAHNKNAEVDLFNLIFEFLYGASFEDFVKFLLFELLWGELLRGLFFCFDSLLNCSGDLRSYLFVAIVNNFYKKFFAFMDSRIVIKHHF